MSYLTGVFRFYKKINYDNELFGSRSDGASQISYHLAKTKTWQPRQKRVFFNLYGKSIEKTKLKPVFVDMIAPEDIEAMLKGEKAKRIRQRAAVRLFEQAKEQQAVFTGVDVATMMRLSPATISNYVRDWEKQNQTSIPRRGTIHDMGRSVILCYELHFTLKPKRMLN